MVPLKVPNLGTWTLTLNPKPQTLTPKTLKPLSPKPLKP